MNIRDYDTVPLEEDKQTYVGYVRDDFDISTRYPVESTVSIKGRRDFKGHIDRLEDGLVVVKIFGETYVVSPREFDSIFYIHPKRKQTWYEKLKENEENEIRNSG